MSIWDKLSGHKSSPSKKSGNYYSGESSRNSLDDTISFEPQNTQDVSSILTSPALTDPSQLHPLAGLNQQTLDYLSLEDSALSDLPGSQSALPSRGWSDDLCYGTGVTYLTSLSVGGAWGLQEGLRRSAGQPPKLRLNSVLNAVTRRGPFLGNSAGVIALIYNGFNSFIGNLRGKHDSVNSIVAGALSGMIFKSTRGLRPMMISGGIVATVAGAWAAPQVIRQPPIIATLNPVCFQTLNLVTQSPLIVQHSIPVHLGDTVLQVKSKQFSAPKGLKMNEPQSMKPADDDPYRMYPVRELNGCFTMRNRMTIDSGDIGPCIWYESDGRFYAVVMKK